MEYWSEKAGKRSMPLESDINTDDIGDIWDHCFLVRVSDRSFLYQYLGQSLTGAYGDDLTGREICESLIYPHPEPLFRSFQKVQSSAQPVHDENEFTNTKGMVVKYRSCVLPLAAKDVKAVGYLLGAMNWRAY